ncbi:bifunctional proline dehydrogenase/L-glutamate gamma-semialdehyde dehydrogenase PutA, partial [Rhizobiaceae bacterium]|nr:bifunctional proline dehydrogenase/L-glutamate gamma-semialdehyde dehydrogenase PutA [Rhizobiaceae bacterium]
MPELTSLRETIREHELAHEDTLVQTLTERAALNAEERGAIGKTAADLVRRLRADDDIGLMETFLAEYGLSSDEGLALMCLAEALLRVPDAHTIDALIDDKIGSGDWAKHFGHSASMLVNASTLGLALTGRVLGTDEASGILRSAARRLGEPVIRAAVSRAMKEMGRQFVLGQTIEEAADRADKLEKRGFTHSYDMLGEAAMTALDAKSFFASYRNAVAVLGKRAKHDSVRDNPGISIKLSALHPRYEQAQHERVLAELVPQVMELALAAKAGNMGLNVDAEEANRLDLSLDVIEAVLSDQRLAGWDGFGVVVQAYGKRASFVIEWLDALAIRLDRKIMVRLVKGAYWDAEVKLSQVEGLESFPVFTRKAATDVSFIACARMLLDRRGRIYPQFATHNAHTVAAILHMAGNDRDGFEFQRLHGMGEALHGDVRKRFDSRCRIYAPVGRHRELLAYLVRRLLENGANSSFVNQVMDTDTPVERVVADPFENAARRRLDIVSPTELFAPRRNARGFDLASRVDLAEIDRARDPYRTTTWDEEGATRTIFNPADPSQKVGSVRDANATDVSAAFDHAKVWDASGDERGRVLEAAADRLEARFGEIFALLAREAGKGLPDALAELREAVDFIRYYAEQARSGLEAPVGTVATIAPWNFPLAIFCGQMTAALAAGNAVLAKPAPETPLIARIAVETLHVAGVPETALQLLQGGGEVGAAITKDACLDGLCFTGSTATAKLIDR